MRFGMSVNMNIPDAPRIAKKTLELLKGHEVLLEKEMAGRFKAEGHLLDDMDVDMLVTVGGDGTILRALQHNPAPIFGINAGDLGFLTVVSEEELEEGVENVLRGHYELEERTKLQDVNLQVTLYADLRPAGRSDDLADTVELYGELHRYIPVLAVWNGFRVGEVDVEHHERRHGSSKFGRARFWRGFLDLVTVKFLTTYTARPFHLFGGIGVVIGVVGLGLLGWMAVEWILGHQVGTRPALLAGVLLVVVAVQMVSLGLLGELMVNLRRRRSLDATADGDVV